MVECHLASNWPSSGKLKKKIKVKKVKRGDTCNATQLLKCNRIVELIFSVIEWPLGSFSGSCKAKARGALEANAKD